MNPFKPKRTFEAVVRELVAGLEDGTIVLNNAVGAPQREKQTGVIVLFSESLGIRMKASSSRSRTNRRHRFVNEWVSVNLDTRKNFPLDFSSIGTLSGLRVSR